MAGFSIVVIAQNEESNVASCVGSCVACSDDVWLIDSFSTDNTVGIAGRFGARVIQHAFESWGAQRNFALDSIDFKHEYVLFLDADEEIDGRFAAELDAQIARGEWVAFNVNFDIVFLGKILRHSHENPPVLRVVKRGYGRWVSEGAREYCIVDGPVGRIGVRIRHEDRKGIFFWLIKHIRNAEREAQVLLRKDQRIDVDTLSEHRRFERPSRVRLRRLYSRLPSVVRPGMVFCYRYVLRLGFLDGYPGLVFCLLQAFWYNLIIDVRVHEMKLGHDCYLPPYGGSKQPKPTIVPAAIVPPADARNRGQTESAPLPETAYVPSQDSRSAP
jgi:glycosyltransferase involved in cell wall biosynthesis